MVLIAVRGLIFKQEGLETEKLLYVKGLMQQLEMREVLLEALLEVGCNVRQVKSETCFKSIAEILRFVLTLYQHEELVENKLLYTILQTSCSLYILPKKRKTYLYTLLQDHELWTSNTPWQRLIKNELKTKIDAANERRKRR